MTLCINPDCSYPNHPDNGRYPHCQSCGSELMIQGRYRVMRLLTDSSGFGSVYEAFERDQPKILKILKPAHSHHPKAIQLFEQEAAVLSRLQHPGVPRISSDGCFQIIPVPGADPLHCIVMEKIDGPNLSEWMRQQGYHPISEHQALLWLQQLGEVLHLIHQQHYFHRDIKPENIMLRSNGQLVLVDFGAVREISYTYFEQLDSTGGITRISSVGYTAPEQERGQAVPQSDFFSLGCTFIYLVTGRKPLDPYIYRPLTNEFHWRPFAPHISAKFADFIDRMTASRVIDRPANTLDILATVSALQDALDVSSNDWEGRRSTPSIQGGSNAKGDRSIPPHSSGSHSSGSHSSGSGRPRSTVPSVDPSTSGGPESASGGSSSPSFNLDPVDAVTLPPDATFIGSISYPAEPIVPSAADSITASASHAANAPPPTSVPALDVANDRSPTTMQSSTTLLQSPRLPWRNPQNKLNWLGVGLLLICLVGGVVWGGRAVYLNSVRRTTATEPDSLLSFTLISSLEGHTAAVNALDISLDQQWLVSASDDRTIRLWDLVAGQEVRQFVGHRDRVQAVVMSPNGQILASGGGDTVIKLWNVLTGEAIANLTGHTSAINALDITSDGQLLVSASADKTIKIWNLATHTEITTLNGHNSFVNDVDISPDGTLLASGSADRTIKLWNLGTYQEIATLSGHSSFVNAVTFSLNGNALISGGADHQIKLWDYTTHQPTADLTQHTSFVNDLAMTLNGALLVSASADQTLSVWNLKDGHHLHSIPWPNTFIDAIAVRFTGSTWQIVAGGKGSHSIHIWNAGE